MPGMLDLSQLTPDQMNALGWLGGAQWGGTSPISMADAQDPMGPLASQDADKAAAATIARRMRKQSPTVPPPESTQGDDSDPAFSQPPVQTFGSLSPQVPAAATPPQMSQPGAPTPTVAPPLPPPQIVKPAPAPVNVDAAALPANSQPTSGTIAPPQMAPAPTPQVQPQSTDPSLLDKLGAGFANFGAGGHQGGLFGAITGAASGLSTGNRIDPVGQQNQTVAALVSRGMPADLAQTVARDPAALQAILPQLMGVKQQQFTQTGEDMFGNKTYGFVNSVNGTVIPYKGSTPFGGGAGQAGGAGTGQIDSSLKGDDYLNQFPPEIQSAVKSYVAGESMPTGNPRAGFVQAVKTIAQKYGADQGQEVDDNTFAARHKAVTGLASTTPGSLGGQMTYARTSLNHLGDVGEAAVNLNNSNGFGIAPLGNAMNAGENYVFNAASSKAAKLSDETGHYGQEITKYYAGSPGGEAERQQFQKSLSTSNTPEQLASVLEAELNLATGKIGKTQATIDESLGPNSKYQVLGPNEQKDIGRVQTSIAKLRGLPLPAGQSPPTAQPGAAAAPQQAAPQAPPLPRVGEVQKGFRFLGGNPADQTRWQRAQ